MPYFFLSTSIRLSLKNLLEIKEYVGVKKKVKEKNCCINVTGASQVRRNCMETSSTRGLSAPKAKNSSSSKKLVPVSIMAQTTRSAPDHLQMFVLPLSCQAVVRCQLFAEQWDLEILDNVPGARAEAPGWPWAVPLSRPSQNCINVWRVWFPLFSSS